MSYALVVGGDDEGAVCVSSGFLGFDLGVESDLVFDEAADGGFSMDKLRAKVVDDVASLKELNLRVFIGILFLWGGALEGDFGGVQVVDEVFVEVEKDVDVRGEGVLSIEGLNGGEDGVVVLKRVRIRGEPEGQQTWTRVG